MKKILSIVIAAALVLACVPFAFAEDEAFDSFGAYEHVFIIGIDGAGAAFDKVDSPNFDRIFDGGAFRHNCHAEYITTSAQNWGSILCGVPYDVHGFTNDYIGDNERGSDTDCPSIFYYARKAMPDAELISFCHWSNINHGIIENDINVKKINRGTDPLVVDAIVRYIDAGNEPALMFVQLDSVDHAAHTYGGFSKQYYSAVEKMDEYLGEIYDAIYNAGLMKNSLFMIVADHGETANGHGGQTVEESSVIVGAVGYSVNDVELNEDVRNRDVAAIALYALGIEQPEQFETTVPAEMFGEPHDVETEANPMTGFARAWRNFLYIFVRMVNLLLSIFD